MKEGHDPNKKIAEWFENTPATWAGYFGKLSNLKELVLNGAELLTPPDQSKMNPLLAAKAEGYQDIIDFIEGYEKIANAMS